MTRYWLSFHAESLEGFEYHGPWWQSGTTDTGTNVCLAVETESEDAAREVVWRCFDVLPDNLDFRFVLAEDPDWEPFSERFPRADWMQWPWGKAGKP